MSNGRVCTVPLRIINRPIMPEIDEEKVTTFMEDMEAGDDFPPIEVLRVVLPPVDDGEIERRYYFSFGGCHRYEACQRLGRSSIKCKIIDVQGHIIRQHLGASCPF
ncbi:hypothetical protein DACRYDRAFT_81619 [Dacryopinax primogenitus]|uniref:Sulfiredoxin n=1 Tax=Dacryopinax primogenitus (strain DJM 731) TaxID=1858805 RepID=M5FUQ6_DACPD|nr:uncharacterized protein DACRYDRAFT_81619 [Dacryopinax primogenitus]EJT99988.1 hypothetical protein DACRYDRAFT_81619 [Dacryopinax primogenitus]